jgi:hypothetical protein
MPQARQALYADGEEVHLGVWPGSTELTADITRFVALDVPYDNAMVFVRDDAEHRGATGKTSPYMVSGGADARENYQFVPETSRRARGFTVYAALRSLGKSGSLSSSTATAPRPAGSPKRSAPSRGSKCSTTLSSTR